MRRHWYRVQGSFVGGFGVQLERQKPEITLYFGWIPFIVRFGVGSDSDLPLSMWPAVHRTEDDSKDDLCAALCGLFAGLTYVRPKVIPFYGCTADQPERRKEVMNEENGGGLQIGAWREFWMLTFDEIVRGDITLGQAHVRLGDIGRKLGAHPVDVLKAEEEPVCLATEAFMETLRR